MIQSYEALLALEALALIIGGAYLYLQYLEYEIEDRRLDQARVLDAQIEQSRQKIAELNDQIGAAASGRTDLYNHGTLDPRL